MKRFIFGVALSVLALAFFGYEAEAVERVVLGEFFTNTD